MEVRKRIKLEIPPLSSTRSALDASRLFHTRSFLPYPPPLETRSNPIPYSARIFSQSSPYTTKSSLLPSPRLTLNNIDYLHSKTGWILLLLSILYLTWNLFAIVISKWIYKDTGFIVKC